MHQSFANYHLIDIVTNHFVDMDHSSRLDRWRPWLGDRGERSISIHELINWHGLWPIARPPKKTKALFLFNGSHTPQPPNTSPPQPIIPDPSPTHATHLPHPTSHHLRPARHPTPWRTRRQEPRAFNIPSN